MKRKDCQSSIQPCPDPGSNYCFTKLINAAGGFKFECNIMEIVFLNCHLNRKERLHRANVNFFVFYLISSHHKKETKVE